MERRVVIADLLETTATQAEDTSTRDHRRADFSARVRVPANARLSLRGFAVRPKSSHKELNHADFVVKANDQVIFSKRLKLLDSPRRLSDVVDLSPFAGEEIDLEFAIVGVRISAAAHWRRLVIEQAISIPRQPSSDGPNLLFILVDTLRADHCSLYGHTRATTPFLDQFARHAAVYDRAISQAPWTLPSVATIFTGTDPTRHGVLAGTKVLSWRETTIAESLQEVGISTFGISANSLISPNKNFDQGFEEMSILRNAPAEDVNAAALDSIDRLSGHRWFGYLHYMDPHTPYDAPPPAGTAFIDPDYDGVFTDPKAVDRLSYTVNFGLEPLFTVNDADQRYLSGRYDGDILHWDLAFADLIGELDSRGLLKNTIIIITSDHGEEHLEHGMVKHGPQLYEESIHVPLVVWIPGAPPSGGRRFDELFELRYLPALALDLMGFDRGSFPPNPVSGSNETGAAFSYAAPAVEPHKPWPRSRIASFTSGRWKLIRWFGSDRIELYDLSRNPGERINLADAEPDTVHRLMEALDQRLLDAPLDDAPESIFDEDIEELRALGYVQ